MIEGLALKEFTKFVPVFVWFERLTHLVLVEYLLQVIAPELAADRARQVAARAALLATVQGLPETVRKSLERLTRWTARFVHLAVVGPMAPNRDWALDEESIVTLSKAGLIGGEGTSMDGKSWLLDREVGEVVGEFFFGVGQNPFKASTVLMPKSSGKPR